jgi:guanine deaminase
VTRSGTVIRGGRVLDPGTGTAEAADIRIEEGMIREVGPPGLAVHEDAATIDAADRLVIPGLVNAHTHAHGGLGRGAVGDRVNLELFLNSAGAVNGKRTLEDKYLSAAPSAVEMVRKGCTACYDLFVEYPTPSTEGLQAIGQAYRDVGMRAVVAPMMADRTLYMALPGLLDAKPDRLRAQLERIAAAPYEASVRAVDEAFRA